ncbi:hypothetical protein L9F63_021681, partial [Diploptera punctata]
TKITEVVLSLRILAIAHGTDISLMKFLVFSDIAKVMNMQYEIVKANASSTRLYV